MSRPRQPARARSKRDGQRNFARAASVWAPCFTLGLGVMLGVVSWSLYGPVPGRLFVGSAVAVALPLAAARSRVVRSARVGSLAGLVSFCYVGLCFVGLSAAAAFSLASAWAGLGLLAAGVCLLSVAVAYHARRRAEEWEGERAHNLGVALDLNAATYAFGADRGFRYASSSPAGASRRTWLLAGLGAGLAAGLPALLPGATGTDPRTYVVLLLGVPAAVALSPLIATMHTNWRRLRAYERVIGREIANV